MCGLTGFLERGAPRHPEESITRVTRMADQIMRRGPDNAGAWIDLEGRVALGFRRLSILDLSPEGHQPMLSASGRYAIVYNGEVYNFQDLRHTLEQMGIAPAFRGHSDTEVMLAAFDAWGVEEAVRRFNGMFALALWDREERVLHLVRDRMGIKPLYYGWSGDVFLFGSELKAMRAHPDFRGEIDRGCLTLLLRYGYIPAPYSIYRGIHKLMPGTRVALSLESSDTPAPIEYWSALETANHGLANPLTCSDEEATERLDALLRDAVALRMHADVPLGAFLSGGIDSSTVVALMQAQSGRPVKTFSIGFHEEGYNEAHHASAVATHLGTDHTELYVTASEAMAVIPQLPAIYDEPFADSSQIPTFLVSQLAREHVTVSLSGDGGDELFAGYDRYFLGSRLWQKCGQAPAPVRSMAASALTCIRPGDWDRLFGLFGPLLPAGMKKSRPGDKLHKLGEILRVGSSEALYHALMSYWKEPGSLTGVASDPVTVFTDPGRRTNARSFIDRARFLDLAQYLPDDILTKVDRASMAVSLEARVPLLDHRVAEFAWRAPAAMLVRNGGGKWLLRQVLYRYVPPSLIERPKMGFGVPIEAWLRGPLRHWAEDLLDDRRLRDEGFFDPAPIRQKWVEHLSGARNWRDYLWMILMFQSWLAAVK